MFFFAFKQLLSVKDFQVIKEDDANEFSAALKGIDFYIRLILFKHLNLGLFLETLLFFLRQISISLKCRVHNIFGYLLAV